MLNLKKVAVTGGLASGKTSLCDELQKLGAYVVSADQIVHHLFSHNPTYVQQVVALLGQDILVNGKVDRKKVAAQVFASPTKLDKLEKLTHPLVRAEIQNRYDALLNSSNYSLFVVEMPLLFETEDVSWYDATVAVMTDDAIARKRFSGSSDEYTERMTRQLSPEKKAKQADYVICNNSSIQELQKQTRQLFDTLISK